MRQEQNTGIENKEAEELRKFVYYCNQLTGLDHTDPRYKEIEEKLNNIQRAQLSRCDKSNWSETDRKDAEDYIFSIYDIEKKREAVKKLQEMANKYTNLRKKNLIYTIRDIAKKQGTSKIEKLNDKAENRKKERSGKFIQRSYEKNNSHSQREKKYIITEKKQHLIANKKNILKKEKIYNINLVKSKKVQYNDIYNFYNEPYSPRIQHIARNVQKNKWLTSKGWQMSR